MKKQLHSIIAIGAAAILFTGCVSQQQGTTLEQNNTAQSQSNTSSSGVEDI